MTRNEIVNEILEKYKADKRVKSWQEVYELLDFPLDRIFMTRDRYISKILSSEYNLNTYLNETFNILDLKKVLIKSKFPILIFNQLGGCGDYENNVIQICYKYSIPITLVAISSSRSSKKDIDDLRVLIKRNTGASIDNLYIQEDHLLSKTFLDSVTKNVLPADLNQIKSFLLKDLIEVMEQIREEAISRKRENHKEYASKENVNQAASGLLSTFISRARNIIKSEQEDQGKKELLHSFETYFDELIEELKRIASESQEFEKEQEQGNNRKEGGTESQDSDNNEDGDDDENGDTFSEQEQSKSYKDVSEIISLIVTDNVVGHYLDPKKAPRSLRECYMETLQEVSDMLQIDVQESHNFPENEYEQLGDKLKNDIRNLATSSFSSYNYVKYLKIINKKAMLSFVRVIKWLQQRNADKIPKGNPKPEPLKGPPGIPPVLSKILKAVAVFIVAAEILKKVFIGIIEGKLDEFLVEVHELAKQYRKSCLSLLASSFEKDIERATSLRRQNANSEKSQFSKNVDIIDDYITRLKGEV